MSRKIVHFEIGCPDIQAAVDFYHKVFGWEAEVHGRSAPIQSAEDSLPGHFNQLDQDEPQQYVTLYIETNDIDEDVKNIVEHGGSIRVPPLNLPDGRRFAWFIDVGGNIMGLITSA